MDTSGSMTAVTNTLDKLGKQRDELGDLWTTRKRRLDLCLQLRLFERDSMEVRAVVHTFSEHVPFLSNPPPPPALWMFYNASRKKEAT